MAEKAIVNCGGGRWERMMILRDRKRRGDGRESDCKLLQLRSGS
jgi:hypothetical protein